MCQYQVICEKVETKLNPDGSVAGMLVYLVPIPAAVSPVVFRNILSVDDPTQFTLFAPNQTYFVTYELSPNIQPIRPVIPVVTNVIDLGQLNDCCGNGTVPPNVPSVPPPPVSTGNAVPTPIPLKPGQPQPVAQPDQPVTPPQQ